MTTKDLLPLMADESLTDYGSRANDLSRIDDIGPTGSDDVAVDNDSVTIGDNRPIVVDDHIDAGHEGSLSKDNRRRPDNLKRHSVKAERVHAGETRLKAVERRERRKL